MMPGQIRTSFQRHLDEYYNKYVKWCSSLDTGINLLQRYIKYPERVDSIVIDTETTGLDFFGGTHYFHHWDFETSFDCNIDPFSKSVIYNLENYTIRDYAEPFLIAVGINDADTNRFYMFLIHTEYRYGKGVKLLKQLLRETQHFASVVMFNAKFDIKALERIGVTINSYVFDCLIASRLTHDRLPKHDLKYLGNYFSGHFDGEKPDKWEAPVKKWLSRAKSYHTRKGRPKHFVNYSAVPSQIMIPYAISDIWYTFVVYLMTVDDISREYRNMFMLDSTSVRIAMRMEYEGVALDTDRCLYALKKIRKRQAYVNQKLTRQIAKATGMDGINTNSHKQLMDALKKTGFSYIDLTLPGAEKPSTGKDVLARLISWYPEKTDWIKTLTAKRVLDKLSSTYYLPLLERTALSPFIHANFKAAETATGRFAMDNPNLQNIPNVPDAGSRFLKGIPSVRSLFVPHNPDDNAFLFMDYSQIELKIFAMYCKEESMLKALHAGEDLHSATARLMFGLPTDEDVPKEIRRKAKAINFGLIYGMGKKKLAYTLGITEQEAYELYDFYFDQFPQVSGLIKRCWLELQETGYVEDIFGRRYHIPIDKGYIAVNSLIQGTAANVLKFAMANVYKFIYENDKRLSGFVPSGISMRLCIHDEVVFEVPKTCLPGGPFDYICGALKYLMEAIPPLKYAGITPAVDAEYSLTHWGAKQPLEWERVQKNNLPNKLLNRAVFPHYDMPIDHWVME
jgi:DNA polymerase I